MEDVWSPRGRPVRTPRRGGQPNTQQMVSCNISTKSKRLRKSQSSCPVSIHLLDIEKNALSSILCAQSLMSCGAAAVRIFMLFVPNTSVKEPSINALNNINIRTYNRHGGWKDPVISRCTVLQSWTMLFYYPLEHILWASAAMPKLVKFSPKTADNISRASVTLRSPRTEP